MQLSQPATGYLTVLPGSGDSQDGVMTYPRSQLVQPGEAGFHHCLSRCVRRAFLCGADPTSGRDFSHRRGWIRDLLLARAECFAVSVLAYAVMSNHWRAPRGALLPCGLKYPNELATASLGSRGQVNRRHVRGSGSSPDNVATHRYCQTMCAR